MSSKEEGKDIFCRFSTVNKSTKPKRKIDFNKTISPPPPNRTRRLTGGNNINLKQARQPLQPLGPLIPIRKNRKSPKGRKVTKVGRRGRFTLYKVKNIFNY